MNEEYIIWQYWETSDDEKPLFVDGLHEIAKNNSGAKVILVTPQNIHDYIPDIPDEIFQIKELAHKADMIRALLIYHHGGMWLDSDAIVLSDLCWLFEMLQTFEFVGFSGNLEEVPLNVSINCFLSRPKSKIMKGWIDAQHAKFPKVKYQWTEVGSECLNPILFQNKQHVKILSFDLIGPIRWNKVSKFNSKWVNSKKILENVQIVMLSNKSLKSRNPKLRKMSLSELSKGENLIADIILKALNSDYDLPNFTQKILNNIKSIGKIFLK